MAQRKQPDAPQGDTGTITDTPGNGALSVLPTGQHPSFMKPPKSMALGVLLTPPLVAIAHAGKLIIECTSELFTETLTGAGRTDKPTPATLVKAIDWTDVEHPQEILLVCNVMMVSAFNRSGGPLTGEFFAIADGDIKADKVYRHVDVRKIVVER